VCLYPFVVRCGVMICVGEGEKGRLLRGCGWAALSLALCRWANCPSSQQQQQTGEHKERRGTHGAFVPVLRVLTSLCPCACAVSCGRAGSHSPVVAASLRRRCTLARACAVATQNERRFLGTVGVGVLFSIVLPPFLPEPAFGAPACPLALGPWRRQHCQPQCHHALSPPRRARHCQRRTVE
jgi:hypothetical protein